MSQLTNRPSASVPITVLGGYLGAGKTTLINRMLNSTEHLAGLAILVNDFGDINIDEALIRQHSPDGQVIGLSNGCVCCTVQDDFSQTLESLRSINIDRILLEASGIAAPAKIKAQCHYPGYHPRGCVVLVNPDQYAHLREDKFVGYLVEQQLHEADLVVTRNTATNKIKLNTTAMDTEDPKLDLLLLGTQMLGKPKPDQAAAQPIQFSTMTLQQQTKLRSSHLTTLLDELPSYVQRVKGFVDADFGELLVQKVGTECNISTQINPQPHQLVFIASPEAPDDWQNTILTRWQQWSLLD